MNLLNMRFLILLVILGFVPYSTLSSQGILKGTVTDAKTQETLIGVSVSLQNTSQGAATDLDGQFEIKVAPGKYNLRVSYLSYKTMEVTGVEVKKGEPTILNIAMEEEVHGLNELVVVAVQNLNTEVSLINSMKNSFAVTSGISAQQISKSQDRDASEVIKRIPGISIIEERFVIARGLSQRYNNVWINNGVTPSSEADTRSFSFDIIPSSQIDNIVIVKSPMPELPADFSGGFIKVTTKSVPSENSINVSLGTNINTATQFKDFKYAKGSGTDFLGFDSGKRSISSFVGNPLDNYDSDAVTKATKEGFNNDWRVRTKTAMPDIRFNFSLNRRYKTESGKIWGLIAALNYSKSSKTYADMENYRYGIYNWNNDKPNFLYKYTDNQYNSDAKLGAIANLVYMPNSNNKIEFRNMTNLLGKDRYTDREGYQYISGLYVQRKAEYLYSSRLTHTSQLAGAHTLSENDDLDWILGFSYANKNQPDRRIINWEENGFAGDPHYGEMQIDQNEISRDFTKLNEYIYSLASNYTRKLDFGNFDPTLKVGVYGEYKDRNYKNREFLYRWNQGNLPSDFSYMDVVSEIMTPQYFGADKLYVYDDTDKRNSYFGKNTLLASYVGANLPFGALNVYAGVRLEYNKMELKNYTSIKEDMTKTKDYSYTDLFPSVNATYNLDAKNLIRLAYGKSINRQEFREVSSSVFYDFDMFSAVKGNPNLKPAYIDNIDLRYELYPSSGEIVSLAVFYKRFKNPIEWTYIDAGGSYTYTFENAQSADNYGVELDVKKQLDFIGLPNFSLSFNGSLIKSKVKFDEESLEHDRPMQGQSPFLVNMGVFYRNSKYDLDVNLLYNIIGKRIVGIGRVETSNGSTINNDIPDMYEMSRNVIDLSASKRFGKSFELSAGIKDILAQSVEFKQFPKFIDSENKMQEREQTTKKFKPGRNISITAKYTF